MELNTLFIAIIVVGVLVTMAVAHDIIQDIKKRKKYLKVKIFYCDTELREIKVSDKFTAFDISCDIMRNHKDLKVTHYLVEHQGEWLYGNDYDAIVENERMIK